MANVLAHFSDIIIPALLFYIVTYGLVNKTNVYEAFLKGAAEGVKTVMGMVPVLIGLLTAVGVLRASGFLSFLGEILGKGTEKTGLPAELMPLILVKLFSSSAATGLVLDIFKTYGTDSRTGLIASIMMSCTETLFYTMSVYFLAVKVTRTRYTLAGALIAVIAGIAMSVVMAEIMI